ncbi:unnamed protein product [Pocillopora meandrina]|uniref:Uncharacterized protein n=1 Tax=Pocillopora meandrina TaxID=46732 RepID=A0AAU9Y3Q5_9CNID|nr:unnamed protein product [Pocillopora meandrina]
MSKHFLDVIRGAIEGWKAPLRDPGARDVKVHCDVQFLSDLGLTSAKWQHGKLIKSYPKATAIEMEGEGLFASEFDHQIGWLVLKGISEYADSTVCSSEEWKTFSSVMAASVVEKILSDPDVFQEWNHYQEARACNERDLPGKEIKLITEGLKKTLKIDKFTERDSTADVESTKKVQHMDKDKREQQDRLLGRDYNNRANELPIVSVKLSKKTEK